MDAHAASRAELLPDGTTVMLEYVDLLDTDNGTGGRDWAMRTLHGWGPDGSPQWSRQLGRFPLDGSYSDGVGLARMPAGFALTYAHQMWTTSVYFDLGCGVSDGTRLELLDSQGRCTRELPIGYALRALAPDVDGSYFVIEDAISGMPETYVHYSATGEQLYSQWLRTTVPSSLDVYRSGELVGLLDGALAFLSPTLETRRAVAVPLAPPAQLAVGPDGTVALLGARAALGPATWGAHALPEVGTQVLLTLRPDGTPGEALALGPQRPLLTADARGLVLALQEGAGLEVRTYGWDAALRSTRHVPLLQRGACEGDADCHEDWGLSSVSSDAVHGIRVAGTLRGELHFDPDADAAPSDATPRAFVLALRR